jgi:hypothetical protein
MATTKQDMPEQQGEPRRERRIIEPQPGDELRSGSMWACGIYDSPRYMYVSAAVWLFDNSATVPSSIPGGPGGREKGATLRPGHMWQVQFTDLEPTPNPLTEPYHLVVRYWKAGGGLPDRDIVDITLSAGHAEVIPECVSLPPPSPGEGTEYPENA